MIQILCVRKRETVSYSQHVNILDLVYQKERNCVMPTICLCSRLCLSKRGKLHHTNSIFMFYSLSIRKGKLHHTYYMFMFQIMCIRKREICIIPTICLCSRFCVLEREKVIIPTVYLCFRLCVSERGKLYHDNNLFITQILCIRKRETVSYVQYDYDLDFVYQKQGNCIIPSVSLCSIFCVSESRKLYHKHNLFMIQIMCM